MMESNCKKPKAVSLFKIAILEMCTNVIPTMGTASMFWMPRCCVWGLKSVDPTGDKSGIPIACFLFAGYYTDNLFLTYIFKKFDYF